MIAFPNAKINIGLTVTGKRNDGYHNLESVFFPIVLRDVLEIIQNKKTNETLFTSTGFSVDGALQNNLCYKAYQLLQRTFDSLPPVAMHIHKNIPVGAGLGGGSSDGAMTLQMLNDLFSLKISDAKLQEYALQLGSDCPFFLRNKPCFVSGRGEVLEPITLDLSQYRILLVNPGIKINTAWAFSKLHACRPQGFLKDQILLPVEQWPEIIGNDFEDVVFPEFPLLREIKEVLYERGAIYAAMTGTGSTIWSLFHKTIDISPAFPSGYFCKWL